jgi:hypothetical protein
VNIEEEGDNVYDPVWENAMQAAVDSNDLDSPPLAKNARSTRDADEIVKEAGNSGFYFAEQGAVQTIFEERTRQGFEGDIFDANVASKALLAENNSLIKRRLNAAANSEETNVHLYRLSDEIPQAL